MAFLLLWALFVFSREANRWAVPYFTQEWGLSNEHTYIVIAMFFILGTDICQLAFMYWVYMNKHPFFEQYRADPNVLCSRCRDPSPGKKPEKIKWKSGELLDLKASCGLSSPSSEFSPSSSGSALDSISRLSLILSRCHQSVVWLFISS